ncbi:MAG: hypothetical protein IPK70_08130 [Flavobacteriales bacterium]|jgi:hypothetical protein|nr:hypothetical protein [Flavobacteriales bacterium]
MQRSVFLALALAASSKGALAQGDLAYMPITAPAMTADDERIAMLETNDPDIVEMRFPPGTYRVDLLNANGNVVEQFEASERMDFDLSEVRTGTWTLRACTPLGFRVRRFVVHQRAGRNWIVEAQPVRSKKR